MNKDIHGRIIDDITKDKWVSYITKDYTFDNYYMTLLPKNKNDISVIANSLQKELYTSNYNIENAYLYLKTLIHNSYLQEVNDYLRKYKYKVIKTVKILKELFND